MAKLPVFDKVTQEDLSDAPKGKWLEALTTPLNDVLTTTKTTLSKNITFDKNVLSETKEIDIDIPDAWQAMALVNGYANNAAPREQSAYTKHPDGTVEIRMSVTGGAGFATMATLPVGYRPQYDIYATGVTGAALINRIQITSAGAIVDGTGAGTADIHFRFLASDATPVPNSKFPVNFSTKMTSKPLYVAIANVEDVTSSEPKKLGCVMSCDWSYGQVNGKPNIKINNICGLPYNRKYRIKFLIVGA